MKKPVITDLTLAELNQKLEDETALYSKLKMTHAVSPIENPLKVRSARKNVARIQTELRKRQLAEQAKK
jgi:large subunit ribosomal protein L29